MIQRSRVHARPSVRARSRPTRRGLVIDAATILGTAVIALLVAQVAAPGGLVGSTASPQPQDSGIVIGGETGSANLTLPPLTTLGPAVNPSAGLDATPTPVPFATLAPRKSSPPATPNPTPATATLKVFVQVQGAAVSPASWTVTVTGASPSPATFKGSSAGTTVRILAGVSYKVTTKTTLVGYTQTSAGDCAGKVAAGLTVNCTFTEKAPSPSPSPSPAPTVVLPIPFLVDIRRRGLPRREYPHAVA